MYQSRWAPQPASQAEKPDSADQSNKPATIPQPPAPSPPVPSPAAPAAPIADSTTAITSQAVESVSSLAPDAPYSYSQLDGLGEDAFAQTGAQQDDLFDDVNPIEEESMRLRSDDDLFNDDFTPAPEPEPEPVPVVAVAQPDLPPAQPVRGRGDGSRGRGRGRGRGGRGDHREQNRNAQAVQASDTKQTASTPPENAPSGPRKDTVPAVRGDRQATGGIRKPKLTEEELAEKMARIQIKNASLEAAHARAEADAASFAEREQVAKQVADQRRKEERRDRQQMMGERERNRQRKLKAMEGREWDAGKRDEDFSKGGRFDKRGGFAGDKEDYTDGREYLYREKKGSDQGKGSRRSGKEGQTQEQTAPKQADFPALPLGASEASTQTKNKPEKIDTEQTGQSKPWVDGGKSWADQMESNTPS